MSDRERGKKRARVTLKFASPPLALPGESAIEPPDLSAELQLPDAGDLAAVERSSSEEHDEIGGRDGWERQRRSVTPPPMAAYVPSEVVAPPTLPMVGDALTLVEHRSRPSIPIPDPTTEMRDRFALDDFTAALRLAELIIGNEPEHQEAIETARACRQKLARLYSSRLGPMDRVPAPAVAGAEVRWLGLDHRDGFVLAQVDGAHTLEEIVDVSGMPRLAVLKTLVELLEMGAIRFPD